MLKAICTIGEPYARDTQIFAGKPGNEGPDWDSEEWLDAKHSSLYLGTYTGNTEDDIRAAAAADTGVDPGVITVTLI